MTSLPALTQLWMMFFIFISVLYHLKERPKPSLMWMGAALGTLLTEAIR